MAAGIPSYPGRWLGYIMGVVLMLSPAAVLPQTTLPTLIQQVHIEYFGPQQGYAVAHSPVVLLCIVRNIGSTSLPERALRVHCYTVNGLDYTDGEMRPFLPPLTPNQAVAFRWRFTPSEDHQPLIAGAQLEAESPTTNTSTANGRDVGQSPLTLAVVPRFDAAPHFGIPTIGVDQATQAGEGHNEAWIASNRVALRALVSDRDEPLLLMAVREGGAWHSTLLALPLVRIRTGEDGQIPWWETMRLRSISARSDKTSSTLTLYGKLGSRWASALSFYVKQNTGAIEAHIRLTARRTMRLYSVQLPRLVSMEPEIQSPHADGSPGLLNDTEPSPLPENSRVVAEHHSGITTGLSWPITPPLPGWSWNRLPSAPIASEIGNVICAPAENERAGEVVLPHATVEVSFRLFASGPSDTVNDALRFTLP